MLWYCTYIYIPFQYLSVVLGAYLFTAADLSWLGYDGTLSWPAKIGVALSVGALGGVGINTAHEMGHKKDSLERWLSKVTLAQTCYGHFYIEHNRGHHVRVATSEDPASARDYVYDEAKGPAREGFPAGTQWQQIPDGWCCPDCGVREKIDFERSPSAGTSEEQTNEQR
jgi:rubredoxin